LRRRRGRSEKFEITNLGDDPIFSRFLIKGATGRTYEISLWHVKESIHHCSCPDFTSNGLGTCKHVEAVLHHLREAAPEALTAAEQGACRTPALVYLDTSVSPPRLRSFVGDGAPAGAEALINRVFGKRGLLAPKKVKEGIDTLLAEAEAKGVLVAPAARDFATVLRQEEELAEQQAKAAAELDALIADLPRLKAALPADATAVQKAFASRLAGLPDWQLAGARHLVAQGRAFLADAPELDKIPQTLAACEFLRHTGRGNRFLLVCPSSRRTAWRAAVTQYAGVEPRIVGGSTNDELARSETDSPYAIVSYNRLYRHLDRLRPTVWSVLVLDEAQRVKTWPASTGQAIKSFRTPFAFVLSSTRLEQRPEAFFYTAQLLHPHLLGPAWSFLEEHVVRDGRGAVAQVKPATDAVVACGSRWLCRTPADLSAPLPGISAFELVVDVTQYQHRKLDPVLRTLLAMARVNQAWSPFEREEVVRLLGSTRTVCSAPELIKAGLPGSPKLEEMRQLVEDLSCDWGKRVVILCREEPVAAKVAARLELMEVTISLLPAEETLKQRKALVTAFEKSTGPAVLVASDAALAGLSLAKAAQAVIHLDLPWSPVAVKQRVATYTPGDGTGPTVEFRLLCSGTPEQSAAQTIRKRPDYMASIVSDPVKEIAGLPEGDEWALRELLRVVVDETMVLRPRKAMLSGKAPAAPAKAFTLRGLKLKEKAKRPRAPQARYLVGDGRTDEAGKPGAASAAPASGALPAARGRPAAAPAGAAPAAAAKPGVATGASPAPAGAPAAKPGVVGDVVVLGLETREDRITASQPAQVQALGLAVAVTYSFQNNTFTAWKPEFISDLVRTLLAAKLVVGYNPHAFEYKILAPYTGRNLTKIPTVDLMMEVTKAMGKKLPFDLVIIPTLEKAWSADRSQATALFKQGKLREAAALCTEGVKVLRDFLLHTVRQGQFFYKASPTVDKTACNTALRDRIDPNLLRLVASRG
jgi:hypothetical protein